MINPEQFREMITEVLKTAPRNLYSETAVDLLMLTAATESRLGYFWKQIKGPARGVFQMEPATEQDIWEHYLKFNSDLSDWVKSYKHSRGDDLKNNLAYQIAMARVHYYRVPARLPDPTPEAMAGYWKTNFNTNLGKGSTEKAIRDYNLYVIN